MSKLTFKVLDGIYDEYLGDIEMELSDDLISKIRSWIEENCPDDDSFSIGDLAEVDQSFVDDLQDAALEYAKIASVEDALGDISEDEDNGQKMYLDDVRSGSFVPQNWDPDKPFTTRDAFKKDEYFEEWESNQPKSGDPDYWDYLTQRYDVYSIVDFDMIPYTVVFPDELYGKEAVYSVF